MKNLVVPTDFSDNALQALRYAINVANEFGSAIHLVNGVDIMAATGIYTDVNNMIRDTAMNKLKDIIRGESKKLENMSLIVPKIIRGEVVGSVCDYAEEVNADLIIMGTKGASGLKEVFMGTVAQGVIKHSKVPVIVVPNETKTSKPINIALALDEQELRKEELLKPFRQLVLTFDAKATVFHFNKQYAMSEIDPSIENRLGGLDYAMHNHYSNEKSTYKVINEFVESEGIDLLVMIRRKRSFLDNLFHKSLTAKEVFHSKIPLLILYDED